MCLDSKKKFRYKIAKEDITCYKVVSTCGDELRANHHYSFIYTIGTLQPKVKIKSKNRDEMGRYSIAKGYHSYISMQDVANSVAVYGSARMVECVIPKGTRYTKGGVNSLNKVDGYVSETIIIKRLINTESVPPVEYEFEVGDWVKVSAGISCESKLLGGQIVQLKLVNRNAVSTSMTCKAGTYGGMHYSEVTKVDAPKRKKT